MMLISLLVGPAKIYFALSVIWLFFYLLSPISYNVSLSAGNVLFLLLLKVLIFFGFFVSQANHKNGRFHGSCQKIDNEVKKVILPALFFFGVVGFALKIYALFYVKGAPITLDVTKIRMSLINDIGAGEGGAVSIFSAVLYPALLIFIPLYAQLREKRKVLKAYFYLSCLLIFIDAFFSGGGTSFVVYFMFLSFSFGFVRLDKRVLGYIVLGAVLVFGVASWLWLERLELIYGGVEGYLENFNGSWIASYSDAFMEGYDDSIFHKLYYVFTWIGYYFVHGYFELVYLINNFSLSDVTLGLSQFSLGVKLWNMVLGDLHYISVASVNVVQGHYQTFWGLAYIDFGYFLLFEAAFLAWLCGYMYYARITERFAGVVFYPFIQSQIVYSFLSNSLSGQISYYLYLGFVVVIVLKYIAARKANEKSCASQQIL